VTRPATKGCHRQIPPSVGGQLVAGVPDRRRVLGGGGRRHRRLPADIEERRRGGGQGGGLLRLRQKETRKLKPGKVK
jgi:hypothetical protein